MMEWDVSFVSLLQSTTSGTAIAQERFLCSRLGCRREPHTVHLEVVAWHAEGRQNSRSSRDGAPDPGAREWEGAAEPTALASPVAALETRPQHRPPPRRRRGWRVGRTRRAAAAVASAPGTLAASPGCGGATSLASSVAAAQAAQESLTAWPQKRKQPQGTRRQRRRGSRPRLPPNPAIPESQGIA